MLVRLITVASVMLFLVGAATDGPIRTAPLTANAPAIAIVTQPLVANAPGTIIHTAPLSAVAPGVAITTNRLTANAAPRK